MAGATSHLSVALDVTPLLGARTGIGWFTAELLHALRDAGGVERLVPYVLSRRGDPTAPELPPGTVRHPLPASLAVRLWGTLGGPAFARRLGGVRVLHGTNFVVPPARRLGLVVTVHDCGFVHFPELGPTASRGYRRAVAAAVRRGAWVHTPSETVADEVREIFDTPRVRAVPHGVPTLETVGATRADRTEPDDDPRSDGPFVLALGTLEPRKRPEVVVTAFGLLASHHPSLRLVLAGADGAARPAVDAAVASLDPGARERVHVLGHVDARLRSRLLVDAAMLVSASRYEGFGLPVLEAMSAGTAVVTTDGGGAVGEIAGDGALVVDGSPEALAEGTRRVLDDEDLRRSLVEAGRVRAARYTWAATARAMIDLYEQAARH